MHQSQKIGTEIYIFGRKYFPMESSKKRFYDLDIQSEISSGESKIKSIFKTAEKLGFKGIAISDYAVDKKDLKKVKNEISNLETSLDIYTGVKLKAGNPKNLKDKIRLFRDQVDVLIVHGGSVDINRAACENPKVDILAHPERERKDSGIDHIIAKEASKNSVAIQINFKQLLDTYGKVRSHILSHQKRNIELCEKFGAPLICSSGAKSIYDMRGPRVLASFPHIMGMSIEDSLKTVSEVPKNILDRAEKTKSSEFIRPGVEREE